MLNPTSPACYPRVSRHQSSLRGGVSDLQDNAVQASQSPHVVHDSDIQFYEGPVNKPMWG
jgi:hypothetical protein